mgnify:CR=1 FL=1
MALTHFLPLLRGFLIIQGKINTKQVPTEAKKVIIYSDMTLTPDI